jgi:tetratricopeptide (TPR) repeat protein
LLAASLIAAAAVAAFSNSFGGPFVFDDVGAIAENPTIRYLWPLWQALDPPSHGEPVSGRPLLNLSLALNYAMSGSKVWGYHVTNLAIHILAALVLFGVLRRTFLLPALRNSWGGAATPLALTIAGLWAVHPLQTESVTYTVQRAESLVGLFYLLTLYGLIRGANSTRAGWWYCGAALACLLGMASKEVMVSAPLVALLYDRTFLAGSFRGAWRQRCRLYLALAGTWLVLGWLVISAADRGGSAGFGLGVDWRAYLGTQFGAIVHYLRLCVWPSPLVLDYGAATAQSAAEIVPYAAVVGALGLATVAALWRWPKIGFLGACFFAILAPTSSVVPVVTQTVAEHRMYLPLAAVLTLALSGGYAARRELVRRGWLRRPLADLVGGCTIAAAALTLGILTFQRNADYRDDLSIWLDTVGKAPCNPRAHYNLGKVLAARGRLDEAVARYRKALEILPNLAEAHINLGIALAMRGRPHEAAAHFLRALEIRPDDAEAHYNLGLALASRGRPDEAIAHFRKALEIRPDDADAHNNLGLALGSRGRPDEAVAQFRKALEIRPDDPDAHHNLALALAASGRLDEAVAQYRKTLAFRPDDAQALIGLADLLATCSDPRFRDGPSAIEFARRADKLCGGRSPEVLRSLAAAQAEMGQFPEAAATARSALELAQQQSKDPLAARLKSDVAHFEAGQPRRGP